MENSNTQTPRYPPEAVSAMLSQNIQLPTVVRFYNKFYLSVVRAYPGSNSFLWENMGTDHIPESFEYFQSNLGALCMFFLNKLNTTQQNPTKISPVTSMCIDIHTRTNTWVAYSPEIVWWNYCTTDMSSKKRPYLDDPTMCPPAPPVIQELQTYGANYLATNLKPLQLNDHIPTEKPYPIPSYAASQEYSPPTAVFSISDQCMDSIANMVAQRLTLESRNNPIYAHLASDTILQLTSCIKSQVMGRSKQPPARRGSVGCTPRRGSLPETDISVDMSTLLDIQNSIVMDRQAGIITGHMITH